MQRRPHPIPLAGRLLALATTVVFSGLGLAAVLTGHYAGRTRQGVELVIEGRAALSFGLGLTLFGLMPMALWQRSARSAGWWAAITLIGGVSLMLFG